jgi:hypothetical protein
VSWPPGAGWDESLPPGTDPSVAMSVAVGISRHGFGDAAAALLHTATHETNTAAVSVLVNLRIGSSLLWTKAGS